VSDSSEDFAALFEASIKAKRFEKGQTIEGRIVAIGPRSRSSTSAARGGHDRGRRAEGR
jgi:hypothetical protein